MDAQTVLTTTRSVRKRVDFHRPVPRELLLECLEVAVQAPTGGNTQEWAWVFVTDPEKKRAIGELYNKSWTAYSKSRGRPYAEDDPRVEQLPRIASSSQYLADRMQEIPVMVIPCLEGRVDMAGVPNQVLAGFYGSILPAAWSFMLAARDRGVVGSWTTLHLKYERETADLLGIPYEKYTQAALLALGFSTGGEFKPAKRLPLDGIVHWDKW
ncbi:MAG TPA: nitroreductase family protein [Candidatus Dormibacteraeota bacterium]